MRLLRQVLAGFGVESTFFDGTDPAAAAAAVGPSTRLVLVESPGNPTLELVDLAAVGRVARDAGALYAVDNTLLTAALQRPFDFGADAVLYSTTKYVEGHNATVGGAVLTRDPELAERLQFVRNATGCAQAPWDAWLTLRGLKTLELRMARHSASALAVAEHLDRDARVARVSYPGLATCPQRELARRQQSAGGGMVAFELAGGLASARRFVGALRLISLAESLGAVESLVTHPATMTHAAVPPDERRAAGIADGLVRLSVGLESPADLIADVARGLDATGVQP